ncbi:MAG: adenylate/guanylate cyclase domain-containing protein [Actinomycetia bacterium]|nr:adenylate/guanylate cyclase domain-containing protein [Actinomycetes bacterium]
MITTRIERKNARYLPWIRAIIFGGVTLCALEAVSFYPHWATYAITAAAAILGHSSPSVAALVLVAAVSVPVSAADFVVGALLLIAGFSLTQYFRDDHAAGFIAIALMMLALPYGGAWGIAVVAGYVLGSYKGALAAAVACVVVEIAGILLGLPSIGVVFSGGSPATAVVSLASPPPAPLRFAWLAQAIADADPAHVASVIGAAKPIGPLIAQPVLWGLAASLGGVFRHVSNTPHHLLRVLAGLAGSTALLAALSAAAVQFFGAQVESATLASSAVISVVIAAAGGAAGEWLFPWREISPAGISRHTGGDASSEDADVDELLRTIASAEEELASRHATDAVVMITDMKAFSRITEEVGSIASAKIVQRHRDLLLPVIEAHGGHGRSTGGDGLVAAFESAEAAIDAAHAIQVVLSSGPQRSTAPQDLAVRIGIASGEVVLDRSGRPFIGAAVNLAARVMDLADGGRVMITSEVARAAKLDAERTYDHGEFQLKNIQVPVRVIESLWAEGLEPQKTLCASRRDE